MVTLQTATGTKTTGLTAGTWTVTSPALPDFSMSISPVSSSVPDNQTATFTVSVAAQNGFNARVNLALDRPAVNGTFNPTFVVGSGTSTLTVTPVPDGTTGGERPRDRQLSILSLPRRDGIADHWQQYHLAAVCYLGIAGHRKRFIADSYVHVLRRGWRK